MAVMIALWIGWLVLMALDAKRYHWSDVPLALQVAGFVLLCLGSYLVWLTFRANSYAAPVVKIQKERGHRVVRDRALRLCAPSDVCRRAADHGRRPAAARLVVGLGRGAGLVLLIAVRAVLEERMLTAELDGYADYAARVRYRLVPHLW